jgi:hypothetical protein
VAFFSKIYCGIFWQNIWRDTLAKYLLGYSVKYFAEYFGKISFGLFWKNIVHDFFHDIDHCILAKYLCGHVWQNKCLLNFWAFWMLKNQGWWFGNAIPLLLCGGWVQGVCPSLVSEKQCRGKEEATGSRRGKFGGVI